MSKIIDLTDIQPRGRRWQILAVWTAVAAIYAVALHQQVDVPFVYALISSAVYYYTLAVLMIPVARWSERLSARHLSPVTVVVYHVSTGVIAIGVWQSLYLLYMRLAVGPNFWNVVFSKTWMFQLMGVITTYSAALGLTLTFQAVTRERERERREAELLILARDSELEAIKAQMQPHFVLNVLNSVLALIDKDPALARMMVTRLSGLIRAVFERLDAVEIPLQREIDFTTAYLEIEQIRFGSRLSVVLKIDEAARDVMVPAFLLQPLVENAIKHGVAFETGPGEVRLAAQRFDGRLCIEVRNSRKPGPMADPDATDHTGRGLPLTRRRLAATYGEDHRLTFVPEPDSLTVRLDLPVHGYAHGSTAPSYSR